MILKISRSSARWWKAEKLTTGDTESTGNGGGNDEKWRRNLNSGPNPVAAMAYCGTILFLSPLRVLSDLRGMFLS